MLEKYLIEYCAPTLASLKSGSLFNCKCSACEPVEEYIAGWNEAFSGRGVHMHLLRRTESRALIYVYRESAINATLGDPEVQEFLSSYGYSACSLCGGCREPECRVENCIRHLESRICSGSDGERTEFPHEIGVFLGYPLGDVKGFIRNKGRNCKYTGTWKVYDDDASARRTFERFEKCNAVYSRLWKNGQRSVLQLTVAG